MWLLRDQHCGAAQGNTAGTVMGERLKSAAANVGAGRASSWVWGGPSSQTEELLLNDLILRRELSMVNKNPGFGLPLLSDCPLPGL